MIIKITGSNLKETELSEIIILSSGYICKDIICKPARSDPEQVVCQPLLSETALYDMIIG
jgi:hypothetical protein